MKNINIKSTLYDILGYLVPGLVVILLVYMVNTQIAIVGEIDWFVKIEQIAKSLSIPLIILFCIGSYIIGHAISSLSHLLIETFLLGKCCFFKDKLKYQSILTEKFYNLLVDKFSDEFSCDPSEKDFRIFICAVESRSPEIYSTAFVFLSFYGMARNYSLIFFFAFLSQVLLYFYEQEITSIYYSLFFLGLAVIFFYEYFRFLKYFKSEIILGYLTQDKSIDNDEE